MTICYQLREWIDMNRLDQEILSCNPIMLQSADTKQVYSDPEYTDPNHHEWYEMSHSSKSMSLLEANPDMIDWYWLSRNPAAIRILEANQPKIDWDSLSLNPAAMHLLEANQDKINWHRLSKNISAIYLLEANLDKIDWYGLTINPAAIHLLEANRDKINWNWLAMNPAIFTYDYKKMSSSKRDLHQQLIAKTHYLNRLFVPELAINVLDYLY